RHALDITVQYSKDRFQFDKPLGAFQALARRLDSRAGLKLKPLVGGLDPDVGWPSLEMFVDKVLPFLP
ncbi:MAG TPA: hypothetical protein VN799_02920, partial [Acidimicrobiales bacterium]|nr:hypothetical protein [Acidimicrobiales bacterium]